jgi:hypothetical protein
MRPLLGWPGSQSAKTLSQGPGCTEWGWDTPNLFPTKFSSFDVQERGRLGFTSGATTARQFERDGEIVRGDPSGPLIVRIDAAANRSVGAAMAGTGIIATGPDQGHMENGFCL